MRIDAIIIAFIAGLAVGAALVALAAERRRRKYLRETTQQMKRSCDIQEQHYSATAMVYRSALEKIEAGDIEGAKCELSNSIAIFYHTKTEGRRELASVGIQPNGPDWTGQELRAIDRDARRFESLRVALVRMQDKPAAQQDR